LQLFLTGGTGFIGRQLLTRLAREDAHSVRCLTRRTALPTERLDARVDVVTGDLCEPESYLEALRGCDVVVHLAGVTGKARRAEYFATNEGGTRALLDACRRANVRRVIFASSIAATYQDKTAYHYAQSKQRAEQAIRDGELNYLIVRPTIVLGKGSPIWNKLVTLAGLPVIPILGDRHVRVQPIYVDDVAEFLLSMTAVSDLPDCAVDLGGPDVVTFEDLLRKIGRALRGRDSTVINLPARATIALLGWTERWLTPKLLPVTAGQLSTFVNDSVAVDDSLVTDKRRGMKTIDEMLALLIHHD
jgi:nucleoside-diphosphate-sugar epimerase